jgi:uncharacterized repeat protein (TIGR03803 family)
MNTANGERKMGKPSRWKIAPAMLVLFAAIGASGQTFTSLLDFDGTNGSYPLGYLAQGTDGNFYGVTNGGGVADYGTIFRLTTAGQLTTIYSFCAQPNCADGTYPEAGLLLTSGGILYGTTAYGGDLSCIAPYGCGTIFKITQQGVLTTIHTFESTDGATPWAGLVEVGGVFYGTTLDGGEVPCNSFTRGCGIVFKMTPGGALTTLHAFDYDDGAIPVATLVQASNGDFYGSTNRGGNPGCFALGSCGTVFRITGSGNLTTLSKLGAGGAPDAPMVQATNGNLYGTTADGTIFKLSPGGKLTPFYQFSGGEQGGIYPDGIIQATDGNLYGPTAYGGSNNDGSLYQLTLKGVLTDLHDFDSTDGFGAQGALLQSTSGTFYGAASYGGNEVCSEGCGTLFSLSMGLAPFVAFTDPLGRPGQTVGILGQGLTGTTSVSFNGTAANFKVLSSTYLVTEVPTGVTSGYVTVSTPSGTLTSNVPFTLLP